MKIGGQIPWNVTPICETSQIYFLTGRRPLKDVLGNQLKYRLYHLVHWLSITLQLRRTSQESINLERKSFLDCFFFFFGYALYAGGIWKGDVLVADLEELETMDASEIYSKRLNAKRGDISQGKWKFYFSSRRWTNQTSWRKLRPENIHLDTGSPNSRRKSP